jgi:phospholipase/carboxylesterase
MTDTASFVLWSKPVEQREGTPLLVLLHGFGADEADLFALSELLPADFTVASVRAGLPSGPGYAWFPLRNDLSFSLDAVKSATADLAAWIDGIRGSHSSVSLLGFSQGMCMATSLARHRPDDFTAVVGLSGFVQDSGADPFFDDAALAARGLPLFWGRDQADPVIPAESVEYTNSWLRAHTRLTKVLYTGIWHGINAQEMGHASEFLQATVLAPAT